MNNIGLVVGGITCADVSAETASRLHDVCGVEHMTADPARSLVHLSGSINLADVLARRSEGTTYRPAVQRGA